MEGADLLEGVAGGDGVDEEEAFACAHVLLSHRTAQGVRWGGEGVGGVLTRILLGRRCRGRRGGLLLRRSRIACGTNLCTTDV